MYRFSGAFASGRHTVALASLPCALLAAAMVACTPQVELREVEVTREVRVLVQRDVSVEVTREVPVTREVQVIVEVDRPVENPFTREGPVTREVPVTRIVTATPRPPRPRRPSDASACANHGPLSHSHANTNTNCGTAQITVRQLATRGVNSTAGARSPPFATSPPRTSPYRPSGTHLLCDHRGYRSMYIDWRHSVVGVIDTTISHYFSDPLRHLPAGRLRVLITDYAPGSTPFVDGIRLNPRDASRFPELWRSIQREYDLSNLTSAEDLLAVEEIEAPEDSGADSSDDSETEGKITLSVNRGIVLIQLDFAVEVPELMAQPGSPSVGPRRYPEQLARIAESAYPHGRRPHRFHTPELPDHRPAQVRRRQPPRSRRVRSRAGSTGQPVRRMGGLGTGPGPATLP